MAGVMSPRKPPSPEAQSSLKALCQAGGGKHAGQMWPGAKTLIAPPPKGLFNLGSNEDEYVDPRADRLG